MTVRAKAKVAAAIVACSLLAAWGARVLMWQLLNPPSTGKVW